MNYTIAHTTLVMVRSSHTSLTSIFFSKRPDDIPRPWDKEEEGDEDE